MQLIYKKWFKCTFPSVASVAMSLCTGFVCNEVFNNNEWSSSNRFRLPLLLGIVVLLAEIYLARKYFKRDEDLKEKQSRIDKQECIINRQQKYYNSLLNVCGDLGAEFAKSSEKIYKIVKSAEMTGQMRLDNWNKKDFYDFICSSLHEYICHIAEKSDDFSVSIITRIITTMKHFTL